MKTLVVFFRFILIICMLVLPMLLLAQPTITDDVDDVPFDGGISLLLAAGVGYGFKKVHDKKKAGRI